MIVNGRKLADKILANLKKEIQKLPRLTVGAVLVGQNPASVSFLKQKSKAAETIGISFKVFKFSQKIKTEKLKKEISKLNNSKNIDGIIVQLPLPQHINTNRILATIDSKKDIDALSNKPAVLSPVVEAVKFIFSARGGSVFGGEKYLPSGDLPKGDRINYRNKNILIIGRGRLVGQPIYKWLARENRCVKIIDEGQKDRLQKFTRNADIIISGVGKGGLIKGEMIKRGVVLIDFGFDKSPPPLDNKSPISARKAQFSKGGGRGDFDFESCAGKAKLITPVPGGMGPIMVAMLFKNLAALNKKS